MTIFDVQDHLEAQPFEPFSMTLTDGNTTFDVKHPELVLLGLTSLILGIPPSDRDVVAYERTVRISLDQIAQIEPLKKPISEEASS